MLLLPGCCDPYNAKALRASRGAAFKLPLVVATGGWPELLALAQGHSMKLIAAEPELQGMAAGTELQGMAAGTAEPPLRSWPHAVLPAAITVLPSHHLSLAMHCRLYTTTCSRPASDGLASVPGAGQ